MGSEQERCDIWGTERGEERNPVDMSTPSAIKWFAV